MPALRESGAHLFESLKSERRTFIRRFFSLSLPSRSVWRASGAPTHSAPVAELDSGRILSDEMRNDRGWCMGGALVGVALILAFTFPHGHLENRVLANYDCVLCHAQRAPVLASEPMVQTPELIERQACPPAPACPERDAATGNHPTRAPPA
jgi:hypothetical protein